MYNQEIYDPSEITEDMAESVSTEIISAVLRICPNLEVIGVNVTINFHEAEPWEISFKREESLH